MQLWEKIGIITQAMKASFYQEMTEVNERKEISKATNYITEDQSKVEEGKVDSKFLSAHLTSEELNKFSKTLKAEIAYARSNFNKGEQKDTRDIWKTGAYDSQRLFEKEYVGGLEKDIYYINEATGKETESYIYDAATDMCFKVKDTRLGGYIVHSLEYAKLMLEGKYETKSGMNVKAVKSSDGTIFFEPDLSFFSNKTDIVYYSTDLTQKKYKSIKDYMKEGNPLKIKEGEETYTFADYSESAENRIWANIRCSANGVESWWVWIPRYAYKLNTSTNKSEIIFVGTDNKPLDKGKYGDTLPEGYTLHEAFSQGDGLKGIWFSKYEPTKSDSIEIDKSIGKAPDMSKFKAENTKLIYYNKDDLSDYKEVEYSANPEQTKEIEGTTYYFYSYEDKIWANIKCNANGIESWWTWIPRYAYKKEDGYEAMSVILVDKNDKPLDTETYGDSIPTRYTVHEAFSQGDGLEGIWFSKYEPTLKESVPIDNTEPGTPDLSHFSSSDTKLIYYNKEDLTDSIEVAYTANPSQTVVENGKTYYFYSYKDKIWANIKTMHDNVVAYWVWIPRYAYRIETGYEDAKVIFVDTNNKPIDTAKYGNTLSPYYKLHEAFSQSDGLKGIWFSKYEPTKKTE